jgi:hypothetical protein
LFSLQKLSAFQQTSRLSKTDFREFLHVYEINNTLCCAFIKDEIKFEDDLIAAALPLEEPDGVNKFVGKFFSSVMAKVTSSSIIATTPLTNLSSQKMTPNNHYLYTQTKLCN